MPRRRLHPLQTIASMGYDAGQEVQRQRSVESSMVSGGGTPAMLERALAIARDPAQGRDSEELVSAAYDLVAWGAFDEALTIVRKLESDGIAGADTRRIKADIGEFQAAAPGFRKRFLTEAINTARDPTTPPEMLVQAADDLLSWGAVDDADFAIRRLETEPQWQGAAAGLKATSRQLRRSGVLSALSPIGTAEAKMLSRPYELLVARGSDNADKIIIAFTGAAKRFWLSLHVLHHYLSKFNAHIVYLNDNQRGMYLNGLRDVGGGYAGLLGTLREHVDALGVSRTHVMASSAGGFIGLRAAADLGAQSYIGFGIRTDLTGRGAPLSKGEIATVAKCTDQSLIMNLRGYLSLRDTPGRITLYSGQDARFDAAHAENLRGLPNADVVFIPGYQSHSVIPALLARGEFDGALQRFLAPAGRHAGA